MRILFCEDGTAITVYTEGIDLQRLGRLSHRRASRVEPTTEGKWTADLSPARGPVLGPYEKRSEALAAEERWLLDHLSSLR